MIVLQIYRFHKIFSHKQLENVFSYSTIMKTRHFLDCEKSDKLADLMKNAKTFGLYVWGKSLQITEELRRLTSNSMTTYRESTVSAITHCQSNNWSRNPKEDWHVAIDKSFQISITPLKIKQTINCKKAWLLSMTNVGLFFILKFEIILMQHPKKCQMFRTKAFCIKYMYYPTLL